MMKLCRFQIIAGAVVLSLIVLAGCQSDEEKAIARYASMSGPAQVRFINFTDHDLAFEWDGYSLESGLPFGIAPRFRTVGAGKQELILRHGGDEIARVNLEAEGQGLYTYAVFGTSEKPTVTLLASDEELQATPTMNLKSFFLKADGSKATGSVRLFNEDGDSFEITNESGDLVIPVGMYSMDGDGYEWLTGGEVRNDSAYSVIVVEAPDGKRYGMLLRSRNPDQPSGGGAGG